MMFGRKKDVTHVHIDFSKRPVVAVCVCGEILRGRNETLPADRIYSINGYLYCRTCALKWLDRKFSMTDYL